MVQMYFSLKMCDTCKLLAIAKKENVKYCLPIV